MQYQVFDSASIQFAGVLRFQRIGTESDTVSDLRPAGGQPQATQASVSLQHVTRSEAGLSWEAGRGQECGSGGQGSNNLHKNEKIVNFFPHSHFGEFSLILKASSSLEAGVGEARFSCLYARHVLPSSYQTWYHHEWERYKEIVYVKTLQHLLDKWILAFQVCKTLQIFSQRVRKWLYQAIRHHLFQSLLSDETIAWLGLE